MKKFFGVFFLLIGLAMIIFGIAALTNVATRNSSIEGRLGNEFIESYSNHNSEQQAAGALSLGVGLIFFIIGIIIVATKSNSQRRKEAELEALKKMHSPIASSANPRKIDDMVKQAIVLYNQKDYYSAIAILQHAKLMNPTNDSIHFNLTCLYSLTENHEAFNSLSKAIEYGYINFEKIKTHPDLSWMRSHRDYEAFAKNGYKIKTSTTTEHSSSKPTSANEDIFSQIEKLGKLKDSGLITEAEFIQQKKKILS